MPNKRKENFTIMVLAMAFTFVVSTAVYFSHNFFYKSFEYVTKFTYTCDVVNTCKFDNINEVYNALKSHTSKESTTIAIIDEIARTSNIRLSTSDVESSINIQLDNNVIVANVTNKDSQAAIFIKDMLVDKAFSVVELNEDITFTAIESRFTKIPDITTYLYATLVAGATLGAILIASDFSFKKKEVQPSQKPVVPKNKNNNTNVTATI